jgi:hypothetical protein
MRGIVEQAKRQSIHVQAWIAAYESSPVRGTVFCEHKSAHRCSPVRGTVVRAHKSAHRSYPVRGAAQCSKRLYHKHACSSHTDIIVHAPGGRGGDEGNYPSNVITLW